MGRRIRVGFDNCRLACRHMHYAYNSVSSEL